MNQRLLIFFAIVLLVVVAAVVVFSMYFFKQNTPQQVQQQSNQQAQQQPDITASWKTYTNIQYNFSFKYPADLGTQYANWNQDPVANVSKTADSNGCNFGTEIEGAPVETKVTINGMQYCLATGGGVGAGQLYKAYNYTTLKDGNYVTLQYVVHTSNGCSAYMGTTNYQGCNDFMNNYKTLVEDVITQSVATLTFTNK